MPLHLAWPDIALRLMLTLAACALIGLDRGVTGHAAGLRTTVLVGLAAAVAMIQANLLLDVGGKTSASLSVLDLMRLPLGILTGVGFIGGGAILRRGDIVTGVTTAATLWVITVIALCLGGGQLVLGCAATALTVLTLRGFKWFEAHLARQQKAQLSVEVAEDVSAAEVAADLATFGCDARFCGLTLAPEIHVARLAFELRWRRAPKAGPPFDLLQRVAARYRISGFELSKDGAE